MNRKASVLDIVVALTGLLFGVVILNVALVSTQASPGAPPFRQSLIFFAVSFAAAFGIGAACALRLEGRYPMGRAAIAFAAGGAAGGAILAGSLHMMDLFEPRLRALTRGGPIGIFGLAAVVGALSISIAVGMWLVRAMTRKAGAVSHGHDDKA